MRGMDVSSDEGVAVGSEVSMASSSSYTCHPNYSSSSSNSSSSSDTEGEGEAGGSSGSRDSDSSESSDSDTSDSSDSADSCSSQDYRQRWCLDCNRRSTSRCHTTASSHQRRGCPRKRPAPRPAPPQSKRTKRTPTTSSTESWRDAIALAKSRPKLYAYVTPGAGSTPRVRGGGIHVDVLAPLPKFDRDVLVDAFDCLELVDVRERDDHGGVGAELSFPRLPQYESFMRVVNKLPDRPAGERLRAGAVVVEDLFLISPLINATSITIYTRELLASEKSGAKLLGFVSNLSALRARQCDAPCDAGTVCYNCHITGPVPTVTLEDVDF